MLCACNASAHLANGAEPIDLGTDEVQGCSADASGGLASVRRDAARAHQGADTPLQRASVAIEAAVASI
jgi:hypothetical protein